MKLLIVIERTQTGYSAYSPDLEGCVATGATQQQVEQAMKAAIELHLAGMREQRIEVPTPHSYSVYVDIPA
jgi:predicted RNase H-like HicB family nuclease